MVKERLWVSNFSVSDVMGGTEVLGQQFCNVNNLKYISARKLGIDTTNRSLWEISAMMDEKISKIPEMELVIFNSTNGWTFFYPENEIRRRQLNWAVVVCCENFLAEAEAIKEVLPHEYVRKKYVDWTFQRMAVDWPDMLVTISRSEQKLFGKQGFDSVVIEPYVDLDTFKPMDKISCRDKLGLPRSKIISLFVGRKHHRKGFDIVSEMEDKFPNIKFVNIVDGNMTKEGLSMFYNAADFLFMPSRYESFGFIYAESLACNLPIISGKVGLMADTSLHHFGKIVSEININSFEIAINEFINEKMMIDSRAMTKERFSIKRFEEECNDVFGNRR